MNNKHISNCLTNIDYHNMVEPVVEVEHLELSHDELLIKGYALIEGVNLGVSKNYIKEIFLQPVNNKKRGYQFEIKDVNREDITFLYSDENDYNKCGFEAKFNLRFIKTKSYQFEMFIKISIDGFTSISKMEIPIKLYKDIKNLSVFKIINFNPEVLERISRYECGMIRKHLDYRKTTIALDISLRSSDLTIKSENIFIAKRFAEITFHNSKLEGKFLVIQDEHYKEVNRITISDSKVKIPILFNLYKMLSWILYIELESGELVKLNCKKLFNWSYALKKYPRIKNSFIYRRKNSEFGWYILRNKIK